MLEPLIPNDRHTSSNLLKLIEFWCSCWHWRCRILTVFIWKNLAFRSIFLIILITWGNNAPSMGRIYLLSINLGLGKSWACKHWKIENIYLPFWCHPFVLDLRCSCHLFVIFLTCFCHFVVIFSFYCHFIVILGMGKWRACPGEFVFGPAWTRSCLPAQGAGLGGGRLKNRVGGLGPGWNGPGGRLRAGKRGRPGNSKNATLPARESFFFSLHLFACFLRFPNRE